VCSYRGSSASHRQNHQKSMILLQNDILNFTFRLNQLIARNHVSNFPERGFALKGFKCHAFREKVSRKGLKTIIYF